VLGKDIRWWKYMLNKDTTEAMTGCGVGTNIGECRRKNTRATSGWPLNIMAASIRLFYRLGGKCYLDNLLCSLTFSEFYWFVYVSLQGDTLSSYCYIRTFCCVIYFYVFCNTILRIVLRVRLYFIYVLSIIYNYISFNLWVLELCICVFPFSNWMTGQHGTDLW
jgi:hypothetical protein